MFGEPRSRIFTVKIEGTKTVSVLRDAIKEKKRPAFDCIPADNLVLWKVKLDLETGLDVLKTIEVESFDQDGDQLQPWRQLLRVFGDVPERGHLHIIVRDPTSKCT